MIRNLKKYIFPVASLAMLFANAETAKISSEEIEKKAKLRIQNFVKPDGMQIKLWADETQTTNPAAIYFDSKGRLLVTEIHRWRRGVEDIRHHSHMLLDDISINHISERLGTLKKHLHKGPWSKLEKPMHWFTQHSDQIRLLEDSNNDGRADKTTLYADGFNGPLEGPGIGVIERDSKVYYTNIPHLWMLEDTDGDLKADTKKSLQEGFGIRMSISGHDMHGMVWGPDGKLYWSVGDRGYSLKTKEGKVFHGPNEGAVFRCNPDGSKLEVFYHRLRNPQELAFDDYGNLFTADNDGDAGDLERYNYLVEGGDSGWHAGHQAIMTFTDQFKFRTAATRKLKSQMSPWMTEEMWKVRHENTPAFILPGIGQFEGGPSGFVFNPGNSLGKKYDNKFFVIHYKGEPSRSSITALDIENDGAGFKVTNQEKFFAGSNCVDVEFGPDGRMYISEFNYGGWYNQNVGNIYGMGFPQELEKPEIKEDQQTLTSNFAKFDNSKLYSLLSRDHQKIRLRAQFELAKRGQAGAEHFHKAAFDESASTFTRIHGIWGLGQMTLNKSYSDLAKLIDLLDDKNDQVRIQTARVLGDNRIQTAEGKLIDALPDQHPRVIMYAGIGLGRLQSSKSIPALIKALKKNNDKDLFLRHGLVMGLAGVQDKTKLTAYAKDESPAVRLAVLLTLRKSKDSQIAGFLNDPNQKIVNEAIRAISDLPIAGATAQLAAHLNKYIGRDVLVKTDIEKFMQHRLINACYYSATKADAERLLKYAQNKSIPVQQRIEALAAIDAWNDQHSLSNITGLPREQPSKRADIKDVVLGQADAVINSAEGEVLAMATRTLEKYGFQLPEKVLVIQALDTKAANSVRIGALKSLLKRKSSRLESVAGSLVHDSQADVRQMALASLIQLNENMAVKAALEILETGSVRDKQNTYKLVAQLPDSRIASHLIKKLDKIIKGANKSATALDVIEAAKLRQESEIKAKLAEYETNLPVGDIMAKFAPAMHGGDIAKGKEIFLNHSGGQCLRCHKVNDFGSDVGPDLSSLGKERDRSYILESVIDPGAKIAPGFGIISMTLKNGTVVSGIFQKETDSEIHVKAADDKVTKYSKTEIASKQPPISGMPPMQFLLKPIEVRDVVAYLATLKAEAKKTKGH